MHGFVKKTAKVTRGKITDSDAEVVCQAFRSNNIHGSSLAQLDDTDWRQLIPNVGVRRELEAATARKIKDEEIALRTISAGSRETESVLQERWISSIKY